MVNGGGLCVSLIRMRIHQRLEHGPDSDALMSAAMHVSVRLTVRFNIAVRFMCCMKRKLCAPAIGLAKCIYKGKEYCNPVRRYLTDLSATLAQALKP